MLVLKIALGIFLAYLMINFLPLLIVIIYRIFEVIWEKILYPIGVILISPFLIFHICTEKHIKKNNKIYMFLIDNIFFLFITLILLSIIYYFVVLLFFSN